MDGEKSVVQDEKVLKAKRDMPCFYLVSSGCCLVWL